jgi:hypothetical protein
MQTSVSHYQEIAAQTDPASRPLHKEPEQTEYCLLFLPIVQRTEKFDSVELAYCLLMPLDCELKTHINSHKREIKEVDEE